MFEPRKPMKLTREQVEALINQTSMFKEYCVNIISLMELTKSNIEFFPVLGLCGVEENVEATLEQMTVYKNYFEMTEMYLKMVSCNIDMWHAMYIDKKNLGKKSTDTVG